MCVSVQNTGVKNVFLEITRSLLFIKYLFCAKRRKSLNTSLQTSVIVEQTSKHVLEVYGTALPVQVTEAITTADREYTTYVHTIIICVASALENKTFHCLVC